MHDEVSLRRRAYLELDEYPPLLNDIPIVSHRNDVDALIGMQRKQVPVIGDEIICAGL